MLSTPWNTANRPSAVLETIDAIRGICVALEHFDGELELAAVDGVPSIQIVVSHESDDDTDFFVAIKVRQSADASLDIRTELNASLAFVGAEYLGNPISEEFVVLAVSALINELAASQWRLTPSDRVAQSQTTEAESIELIE